MPRANGCVAATDFGTNVAMYGFLFSVTFFFGVFDLFEDVWVL